MIEDVFAGGRHVVLLPGDFLNVSWGDEDSHGEAEKRRGSHPLHIIDFSVGDHAIEVKPSLLRGVVDDGVGRDGWFGVEDGLAKVGPLEAQVAEIPVFLWPTKDGPSGSRGGIKEIKGFLDVLRHANTTGIIHFPAITIVIITVHG